MIAAALAAAALAPVSWPVYEGEWPRGTESVLSAVTPAVQYWEGVTHRPPPCWPRIHVRRGWQFPDEAREAVFSQHAIGWAPYGDCEVWLLRRYFRRPMPPCVVRILVTHEVGHVYRFRHADPAFRAFEATAESMCS